jgi:hypothetical protein
MERLREIPDGSIEVQTGLWAWLETLTFGNITRAFYRLYSAEGYCFYDKTLSSNLDEDGNLLPENERMYAQYQATTCTTIEQINARFVSVPVQDGYEIVSVGGNNQETM